MNPSTSNTPYITLTNYPEIAVVARDSIKFVTPSKWSNVSDTEDHRSEATVQSNTVIFSIFSEIKEMTIISPSFDTDRTNVDIKFNQIISKYNFKDMNLDAMRSVKQFIESHHIKLVLIENHISKALEIMDVNSMTLKIIEDHDSSETELYIEFGLNRDKNNPTIQLASYIDGYLQYIDPVETNIHVSVV